MMIMKIRVAIEYLHTDDDDRLTVKVRTAFGILRIKREIPVIKINQEDMTVDVKEQTNSALKKIKEEKIGYREVFDSTKQIKNWWNRSSICSRSSAGL
ncbi:hypothetical protein PO124_09615 [Bacillus licheniformis]|nr:hypothetical protein [Bacillus licheniformis]